MKPKKKKTGNRGFENDSIKLNTLLFYADDKKDSVFVLQKAGRQKDTSSAPKRVVRLIKTNIY